MGKRIFNYLCYFASGVIGGLLISKIAHGALWIVAIIAMWLILVKIWLADDWEKEYDRENKR